MKHDKPQTPDSRFPHSRMHPLLRALPLAAFLGCSLGTAPDPPEGALKVLFIGNSLTYENDLPRTVADLALSAGAQECYCVAIANPGFSLEDHWDFGDAVTALEDETWDFVVMQQGPSALPDSRSHLVLWAGVFGNLIADNGAEPVMYGVWPAKINAFQFTDVHDSYRAAADAIGATLAPAGSAWQVAWQADADLPLYSSDEFHPSPMGTYLAALVVFERLYERTSVGVQSAAVVNHQVQPWSQSLVRLLQESATAANLAEDAAFAARTK